MNGKRSAWGAGSAALVSLAIALWIGWGRGVNPHVPAPATPDPPARLLASGSPGHTGTSGPHVAADIVAPRQPEPLPPDPRPDEAPADIAAIKERLYALEIESVDRIALLEELVETGEADVQAFWSDGWGGVDDWKRYRNGFHLEQLDDGSLVFFPDEETMRTYSFLENLAVFQYDEQRREFVSEIDYYGKKIRNVLKFLGPDALVMMTISGWKVDLNLYQRSPSED